MCIVENRFYMIEFIVTVAHRRWWHSNIMGQHSCPEPTTNVLLHANVCGRLMSVQTIEPINKNITTINKRQFILCRHTAWLTHIDVRTDNTNLKTLHLNGVEKPAQYWWKRREKRSLAAFKFINFSITNWLLCPSILFIWCHVESTATNHTKLKQYEHIASDFRWFGEAKSKKKQFKHLITFDYPRWFFVWPLCSLFTKEFMTMAKATTKKTPLRLTFIK